MCSVAAMVSVCVCVLAQNVAPFIFIQTSPFIQSMTPIHEYQFCPPPTMEHDTLLIKELSVGYYFIQIVV